MYSEGLSVHYVSLMTAVVIFSRGELRVGISNDPQVDYGPVITAAQLGRPDPGQGAYPVVLFPAGSGPDEIEDRGSQHRPAFE